MKRTRADAEQTRAKVLDAALSLFAQRGIGTTSLDEIATRAGVTRGAVYWHFEDKSAMVQELLYGLDWPLDIGTDLGQYQNAAQPMQLLRRNLWRRMKRCMQDGTQWRCMQMLLRIGDASDLPDHVAHTVAVLTRLAVQRMAAALAIAHARGELRPGIPPLHVAECLHVVGMGVLSEQAGHRIQTESGPSSLPLMLVMLGACGDARTTGLMIEDAGSDLPSRC